jgi:hypothetical protein
VKRQAKSLTLSNDPAYPGVLNNLGNALTRRFQMTSSLDDLNQAIT